MMNIQTYRRLKDYELRGLAVFDRVLTDFLRAAAALPEIPAGVRPADLADNRANLRSYAAFAGALIIGFGYGWGKLVGSPEEVESLLQAWLLAAVHLPELERLPKRRRGDFSADDLDLVRMVDALFRLTAAHLEVEA